MLRPCGGIALEIGEDIVDTCDALAFGVRLLFQQLPQHSLRSVLDRQRNEREQIHHTQELVLILARQTLDGAHESQNVVGDGHNGFLFV